MPRKQPLGLTEGEKEGERKKWCGVMTRWTPGARRDTPGFIGLGTLQGPRYTVCVRASVHHWIHQLHTHTRLHFKEPFHAMDSYPAGSPPPKATDVAMTTRKQILVVHGMLTPCTQVKFAITPFFSSPHLSFSGVVTGMQLSFMTKRRHAADMLMYGSMSVYAAEYWSL